MRTDSKRWRYWVKTVWAREDWSGSYAGGRVEVYLSVFIDDDVVVRCGVGVHGTDDTSCSKHFAGKDFDAARRLAQSICDGITAEELYELGFDFNGWPHVPFVDPKEWARWLPDVRSELQ